MILFDKKQRGFVQVISLIVILSAVGLLGGSFIFGRNYSKINDSLKESEEMIKNKVK